MKNLPDIEIFGFNENVTNYEVLQANQNEHVALMVLVLERDSIPAQKLIEAHIMTPVEIIKKNLP